MGCSLRMRPPRSESQGEPGAIRGDEPLTTCPGLSYLVLHTWHTSLSLTNGLLQVRTDLDPGAAREAEQLLRAQIAATPPSGGGRRAPQLKEEWKSASNK